MREDPQEEFIRLERGFGSFRRAFEIPGELDHESITAKLEHGVLRITVPRRRRKTSITIESEEE